MRATAHDRLYQFASDGGTSYGYDPASNGSIRTVGGAPTTKAALGEGGRAEDSAPLPAFSESNIDRVVAASRAPVGQITQGARAIAKKQGQGAAPFAGITPLSLEWPRRILRAVGLVQADSN